MHWNHDRGYWGQCDTRGATCIGTKVGVSGVDVTLGVLHALEPR